MSWSASTGETTPLFGKMRPSVDKTRCVGRPRHSRSLTSRQALGCVSAWPWPELYLSSLDAPYADMRIGAYTHMRATRDSNPFQNVELCTDPHIRISAHAREAARGTSPARATCVYMRLCA